MSRHQSIAAVTTFDFSRHPGVARYPCWRVTLACHDYLPHLKPQIRRDEALAGSQHQHLALQIFVLVFCIPLAAIIVAAICPHKVGGIIANLRYLALEKLIKIQVSHGVNGITEYHADC